MIAVTSNDDALCVYLRAWHEKQAIEDHFVIAPKSDALTNKIPTHGVVQQAQAPCAESS